MKKRSVNFWVISAIGWLLAILLVFGQTLAVFDYDLTVSWGLQESLDEVGKVGIAYAKGFGFGDTLVYLPLLVVGLIGFFRRREWAIFPLFGAMAITAYWPLVCLYAVLVDKTAIVFEAEKYATYGILLPAISIYGLWGMWVILRKRGRI